MHGCGDSGRREGASSRAQDPDVRGSEGKTDDGVQGLLLKVIIEERKGEVAGR